MSQALFEKAVRGRHSCASAGTQPAERIHPVVVAVMQEIGIDLGDRKPQKLTAEMAEAADVVVTMGCRDECPYIHGKQYIDWELSDPNGLPLDQVRKLRDDIAVRVEALAAALDAKETSAAAR